jgi:hypothetical protein
MSSLKVYAAPHKGLRNILSKFVNMAGCIDYKDAMMLQALQSLGNEMFLLLENHAYTETNFTLEKLDFKVSGASQHDRDEHIKIAKLQLNLKALLANLNTDVSADESHLFYLQSTYFQSEYLYHIFEEETETEPIIKNHFTDEELLENKYEVVVKMNFEILLIWMKYIIEAQTIAENIAMLNDCKYIFESTKFVSIMDVAKSVLPESDFRYILIEL